MREKILRTLAKWSAKRTGLMLLVILVITLIFGYLSSMLEINMNLTMLLPKNDPMVDEFNVLFEEFNGANTMFVVVEGEQDDMIRYAEFLSPRIKELDSWIPEHASDKVKAQHESNIDKTKNGKAHYSGNYYTRVEYKMPIDFIRDHGLMLMNEKDLKTSGPIFTDPNLPDLLQNINNTLEQEYIQSDEKISTTQKERSAVQFLDGIETFIENTEAGFYSEIYSSDFPENAADAISVGSPYMISPDRSMLLIMAEPSFTIMDMNGLMPAVNGLEEMVKSTASEFSVKAGLAGSLVLGRDEMVAGTEDSYLLTLLALAAIFILFVITFRMISAPFLAIINLVLGIVWAMGMSYLLVPSLNLFTAMVAVILVGLGIDFSIHIISLFSELTNQGVPAEDAIVTTMEKAGTGIITGAFTTAAAFLTIMISSSQGMKEFGLVNGVGLIVIMIATLIIMPTLLMMKHKISCFFNRNKVGKKEKTRDVSYVTVGKIGSACYSKWKMALVALGAVTIILGIFISKVTFDYNYLNMEPVGLESIELNDKIIDKFNMSSDATSLTASSLEENEKFTKLAKEKSSVSYVESITDLVPPKAEQLSRKAKIQEIHNIIDKSEIKAQLGWDDWNMVLDELLRLEANVIEIQDMSFIGGQDMVDDKASRLVGDANLSRAVMDLDDLLFDLENSKGKETLAGLQTMLTKFSDNQAESKIQTSISDINKKLQSITESQNPIGSSKAELQKILAQLQQIYEQPEYKGRLTAFASRITESEPVAEQVDKFNRDFGKSFKKVAMNMADTTTVTIAMLPEFLKSKYISKSGDKFLITAYPKGDVWNIQYLELFSREMLEVTPRIAGTPPMFYYLIKIIGRDGRNAALLTLFVVFLVLLIDFRSLKMALLTMVPLLAGTAWMLGMMGIFGIQITLVNVIALPLILGIGIDDGVHLLHRYRIEGKNSIGHVYSSTGKAIIITSLTTMLSFGSLVFATYRGYGSLGIALFIGVGACLLTSILVLPMVLGMINKKSEDSNR